ncbi:MAG: hypothetical protein A2551_04655 [Elusimicrobia bacterium RIFOXYD2_FULL_34_30]|nr:MAG: hypothetical protein A2551_04655 [Elusimicrobia bacterium RIFOXYD2_FULL_34_30]
MDLIQQWCQNNLDIIFFIYGLAFVFMGVAILIQPKADSKFVLANILWLLGVFGIIHGINEFLDMWIIIKSENFIMSIIKWFILIISYYFLFEFGRKIFSFVGQKCPTWRKKIAKPFVWWLTPAIILLIIFISIQSSNFYNTASLLSRYFLGFPGGILIAIGFLSYYKCEEEILKSLKVKKFFIMASFSFFFYGILSGLIVSKSNYFPANWINTETFLSILHIPVQVFRAICAIAAGIAITGILRIFNWETTESIIESRDVLEKKLADTEKRYEDIVENASDMIHSVNVDGHIVFANRKECEILGYSREELNGKNVKEVYAPETRDYVKQGFEKLKREGILFIENGKMIKKNEEILDVIINSSAIYDSKGNFIRTRSIIKDVTEQKSAEKQIRNLAKFPAENPNPVLRVTNNCVIVYANESSLPLLKEWECDINRQAPVFFCDLILRSFQTKKKETMEIKCKDKEYAFILSPVVEAGYVNLYGRDITKEKEAIKLLRENEEKYRTLIEYSDVAISSIDKNGVFLFMNTMAAKLLGNNVKVLIGKTMWDLFPKEIADKQMFTIGKVYETGQSINVEDKTIINGKPMWFRTNIQPIRDNNDQIKSALVFNVDITEHKQMEELKEKFKEKLLRVEKITAVGQLAGGIAHELNNPIGVILGFAQSLAKNISEKDLLYMPLKSMEREAIKCKKLVKDLLTFSRDEKTIAENIDMNVIIEETLPLLEAQRKMKDIQIVKNYENNLPQILINKDKIQQVIVNLCNNAMDAMPQGGKITITTTVAAEQSSANISKANALPLQFIVITISDTGVGMSEEVKKHIFEPFYTTKEVGKGTGLGLSICYEIVKKHNGIIEVESPTFTSATTPLADKKVTDGKEVGKGTTFVIKLPVKMDGEIK